MTKNIYRVLILAGLLIGAAFVIVPAGNEILGENINSALALYAADITSMAIFYGAPLVLLVAAFVLSFVPKAKTACFLLAAAGGVLFLAKDFMIMLAGMGYTGCLVNAAGAILAMAGAALLAFDGEEEYFDDDEIDGAGISTDEMDSFFSGDFYESGEKNE